MRIATGARRVVHWAVGHGLEKRDWERRADDNVLTFLSAALSRVEGLTELVDPEAFVDFVRGCLNHREYQVVEIKHPSQPPDAPQLRFSALLDMLRTGALPVPFDAAVAFARIADTYRGNTESLVISGWAGDIGLHFSFSSSLALKGRLLWNSVRFLRCTRGLELGTAYGMSALFLLDGMRAANGNAHLTTVEGFEPLYSLASHVLGTRFGDRVTCVLGNIGEVLPKALDLRRPLMSSFTTPAIREPRIDGTSRR